MGITVDIDPAQPFEGATLLEAVIKEAGQDLANHVIALAGEGLEVLVAETREKAVRERVVPIVEAVIQGPIQRTNRLGEPLGLPTTLKELVASTALEALTKPVKESYKYLSGVGVPKDDSRSLVEYFVDRYVRLALVNEIKQVAEDVVKATQFGGQLTDDLQNGLVAALRQAADRMQAQGDSARPA